MNRNIWVGRLARAALVVGAIVAAVPISAALGQAAHAQLGNPAEQGVAASQILGPDPFASLAKLEDLSLAKDAQVPGFFEEEIGFVAGARDIRVSSDGRVVGYLVDEMPQAVLRTLSERMARAGWSEVSLGSEDGATFVKDSGTCTWALVTCTQVDAATSVVVRCVVA